jgi:tetratricopeptide (TPR) repeat protein
MKFPGNLIIMKLDPILTKAIRSLRRRKYGDVITLLQPEVVRYHDSFNYYYILGSACLRAGDLGGAFTYFKRARDIKMREPLVLLGMAIYYLQRGDTERAVDIYLEVLDTEPRNRIAKKALLVLRKYSGTEALQDWIDSGKSFHLFPPLPKMPLTADRFLLPLGLILALGLIGGALVAFRIIPSDQDASERIRLPGIALEQEERETPVQIGGSYRYILTRNQVLEIYENARKLFTEYRDEAAKLSLNRLIESNASDPVKNKARLLISYMDVPGFDTFKTIYKKDDNFSYRTIKQDPVLYRDCYVIWQGMATNMDLQNDSTSFDFLINYDTRRTLEGIVKVQFDFAASIDMERPIQVLGKVIPISVPGGEDIRLEGIAINQSPRSLPGLD